jgi:hypothetical protein
VHEKGCLTLFLLVIVAVPALAKSENASIKSEVKQECTTIQSGDLLNSVNEVITTGYDDWGYNYQAKIFNGTYCDAYRDAAWCQPYADVNLSMKWNDAWLSNKDCSGDDKLDRHYGHISYIGSGAWLTNHMSGEYEGEEVASWNVSGNWLLDFHNGTENREFRNLVQDENGNVTGDFYWKSGSNWLYGGTLDGNVVGDALSLYYERPPAYNYTGDFEATISETGLVGTFSDSNGGNYNWTAKGVEPAVYESCSWSYFVKIVAAPADAEKTDGVWHTPEGKEIGPVIWNQFAIIQEVYNDACAGEGGLLYKSPVKAGLGGW